MLRARASQLVLETTQWTPCRAKVSNSSHRSCIKSTSSVAVPVAVQVARMQARRTKSSSNKSTRTSRIADKIAVAMVKIESTKQSPRITPIKMSLNEMHKQLKISKMKVRISQPATLSSSRRPTTARRRKTNRRWKARQSLTTSRTTRRRRRRFSCKLPLKLKVARVNQRTTTRSRRKTTRRAPRRRVSRALATWS